MAGHSTSGRPSEGWARFVAGGVAGSAAVVCLHPFDVIKTRMQVQDGMASPIAGYRGMSDAAALIRRREGLPGFYAGLTPALLGSGIAWASYFAIYEDLKGRFASWQQQRQQGSSSGGGGGSAAVVSRMPVAGNLLCAGAAGAVVCLLTNPLWLIKTRLALQNSSGPAAAAAAAAAAATSSSSAQAAALRPPPCGATYRSIATAAAAVAETARPLQAVSPSGAATAVTAAAGNAVSSSPLLSASAGQATAPAAAARGYKRYGGLLDALLTIGREEGIRGYYKGLGPSLLLQTSHGAVQFAVYEELKLLAATWGAAPSDRSSSRAPAGASAEQRRQPTSGSGSDVAAPPPQQQQQQQPLRQLGSLEISAYAALSKLVAAVTTYPVQLVRARLQQRLEGDGGSVYASTAAAVRVTYSREGLRGFYKGLAPGLVRVMPQSAITLAVYEKLARLLLAADPAKPDTGS